MLSRTFRSWRLDEGWGVAVVPRMGRGHRFKFSPSAKSFVRVEI